MQKQKSTLFFLFAFLLLNTISAFSSDIQKTPLEKTGRFTQYSDMISFIKSIASLSPSVKIEETAKTAGGGTPIYKVSVNKSDIPDDEKLRILITARVHGSEPAGMEAAAEFIRNLAFKPEYNRMLDDVSFTIIPCANPDGTAAAIANYRENGGFWDKTGRHTSQGLDINRDFNAVETDETVNCISIFNDFNPHIVVDLHEFAGTPVVAGEDGWWRGRYFDELVGAGRNPDVYPPISQLSRMICENYLFREMKAAGIKIGYYPNASGNLDTTYRFATTGADYYNLRNAMSFLVETGSYDQGESTIKNRTDRHLMTLRILIREFRKNKTAIRKMTEDAKQYSKERNSIVIKQKLIPYEVEIEGIKSSDFSFATKYTIDGKTYKAKSHVRFKIADPNNQETLQLPSGYAVICQDAGFVEKLLVHKIEVYETTKVIITESAAIPAHAFYIPAKQESSAIIAYIMEPESYKRNRFALNRRAMIIPIENNIDINFCKRIFTNKDINNTIERHKIFMEETLKKTQQNN